MSDRAAAAANPPSGARGCRLPGRGESRRQCAQSGLDRLAHSRYARRPAARRHQLPDAGVAGVQASCAPLGSLTLQCLPVAPQEDNHRDQRGLPAGHPKFDVCIISVTDTMLSTKFASASQSCGICPLFTSSFSLRASIYRTILLLAVAAARVAHAFLSLILALLRSHWTPRYVPNDQAQGRLRRAAWPYLGSPYDRLPPTPL